MCIQIQSYLCIYKAIYVNLKTTNINRLSCLNIDFTVIDIEQEISIFNSYKKIKHVLFVYIFNRFRVSQIHVALYLNKFLVIFASKRGLFKSSQPVFTKVIILEVKLNNELQSLLRINEFSSFFCLDVIIHAGTQHRF